MKKNLMVASVFLFGLVLGGASARASSSSSGPQAPSITPEMAECVNSCQAAGGNHTDCWNCCVRNICPV